MTHEELLGSFMEWKQSGEGPRFFMFSGCEISAGGEMEGSFFNGTPPSLIAGLVAYYLTACLANEEFARTMEADLKNALTITAEYLNVYMARKAHGNGVVQ